MADLKKFLDQGGVSILWSRIGEELKKVDDKAVQNAADIVELQGKVDALEKGTYDDTAVRELIQANADAIAENKTAHEANAAAIEVLNGDAETVGSVANTATTVAAAEVAKIVANADADFDTLKEIADWILNDTTGAADMANDIAALQAQMVGIDETVVKSVAAAIDTALKVDGADKYALASDLVDLANRVKALEDAGYMDEVAVNAAIDSKITALKLSETYDAKGAAAAAETAAKAYADGLAANYDAKGAAATAEANAKAYADGLAGNYDSKGSAAQALIDAKAYADGLAGNYDANGAAAQALADAKGYSDANLVVAKAYSDANLVTAKSYTDTEVAKIQALTEAEIDAAIAQAKA
jgi:hypothetical protein